MPDFCYSCSKYLAKNIMNALPALGYLIKRRETEKDLSPAEDTGKKARKNASIRHVSPPFWMRFELLFRKASELAPQAMSADVLYCGTPLMSSVPPETRGVSSGMRATFQNSATLVS